MQKIFVKICGITNDLDALEACECGSNAIGFIAYTKSKRFVNYEKVRLILEKLSPDYTTVYKVGVFVDSTITEILTYVKAGINVVQLHGNENEAFICKLRAALNEYFCADSNSDACEIWKAVKLKDQSEIKKAAGFSVDKILVDTFSIGQYGGIGETGDWELAKFAVESVKKPLILAGGLNCNNVMDAIKTVSPYGIDLSSGVEKQPGIKDHRLLRELFSRIMN